jgi:hypothetical protein
LRHSHKTWLIAGGAPEIAQARRLGHHLDNRVIETYSHVAPEVEQRLLEDLERRWHTAAPPPPTPSPSVVDGGRMALVVPLFATGSPAGQAREQQEHRVEAVSRVGWCSSSAPPGAQDHAEQRSPMIEPGTQKTPPTSHNG